jgi:hypothetical protein
MTYITEVFSEVKFGAETQIYEDVQESISKSKHKMSGVHGLQAYFSLLTTQRETMVQNL